MKNKDINEEKNKEETSSKTPLSIEEKFSHLVNTKIESYVSLKHINKVYGNGVQAVYDFNLDIDKHDFVVFVGPSGCGKSTTLRMIAGLEEITAGELYIAKVYSNNLSPKDRDIAMVFQNYALYPHMSVYDNMSFGLKMRHVDKSTIDSRVFAAAETLQLTDYLDRKPKELSGGQMQRVALGRTIVRDAKLFLMDEPLSNLDAKLRVQMRGEIVSLHEELGATTIYVTHDQTEAMTMATKIVVMNKGFIQQIGTPEEIYNHPATKFVATFIGSPAMNIIDGIYNNGTITLVNGTKFELNEEIKEVHNNFYKNEIELLHKRLDNIKFECELLPHRTDKKNTLKEEETIQDNQIVRNDENVSFSKIELDEIKIHKIVSKAIVSGSNKFSIKNILKKKTNLLTLDELIAKKGEEIKTLIAKFESYLLNSHEISLGIRPEDIKLSEDNSIFDRSMAITIDLDIVELLGSEYYVHSKINESKIIAKISADNKLKAHTKIDIVFNVDKIHLFDINNEKCIK